MPLEFEENTPNENRLAAPPLETPTEAERLFTAAWRDSQYERCLELISQLPATVTPETIQNLTTIALCEPHRRRWNPLKKPKSPPALLRRECVRFLGRFPSPKLLSDLRPLLFDSDVVVQETAFALFGSSLDAAVPILVEYLAERLESLDPHDAPQSRGVSGALRFCKAAKDARLTDTLGDALLRYLPRFMGRKKLYGKFRAGGIALGAVVALWVCNDMALEFLVRNRRDPKNPQSITFDWIFTMLVNVLIQLILAGILARCIYILCLPLIVSRYRRRQAVGRAEIVSAMQAIGDKRTLKYLMQSELEAGASAETTGLTLELLPLIDAGDGMWLGEIGGNWLTKCLIETTPGDTVIRLKSAEILGDERHIYAVQRLSVKSKFSEVRESASRALAVLESRRDAKKEKRELLRASATPEDYKETLLRPLQDKYDPQEEQELLHPAEKPDE